MSERLKEKKESTDETDTFGKEDSVLKDSESNANSYINKETGSSDVSVNDFKSDDVNGQDRPAVSRSNTTGGMAKIKPEFIDHNHQKKLAEKFIPKPALEQVKRVAEEAPYEKPGNSDEEPPKKKAKLKGRNKKRPRDKRPQNQDKLCPKVIEGRECIFGEKCRFSHNVAEFVQNKPAPFSDRCYLFDTFGKCSYGVSCLCAAAHTKDDYSQIVNEELWQKMQLQPQSTNKLDYHPQSALWKKKYDFKIADQVAKTVNRRGKPEFTPVKRPQHYKYNKDRITGDGPTGNSDISNNQSDVVEVKQTTTNTDLETHENELNNVEHLRKLGNNKMDESTDCDNTGNLVDKREESVMSEDKHLETCDSNDTSGSNVLNKCDSDTNVTPGTANDGNELVRHDINETSEHKSSQLEVPDLRLHIETEEGVIKLRQQEKRKIDFRDKLYLAPLTTVGNLPFRRICKSFGVDITCGEMATAAGLLQGHKSEWALLRRHHTEDIFGAQVCGTNVEMMTRCTQVVLENTDVDFIDINCGCPIELFYKKGEGCALMGKVTRLQNAVQSMNAIMDVPLTVKMRTGIYEGKNIADRIIPPLRDLGVSLVTLHGRSREQRYTRQADWDYINHCSQIASPMPLFGNGDVLSYEDYNLHRQNTGVAGCMIARGALMKPWVFTEIKEQRHWDISSGERLDMLKDFTHYGLEQWGSDLQGVQITRRFLLEWLSFLHRYIPVGVLETLPQRINEKPPYYIGRNDLETLMASPNCADWIKISEMLLGPVPEGFQFLPKHKANSYQ